MSELLNTGRYFTKYEESRSGLLNQGNQVVVVDIDEESNTVIVVKPNDDIVERINLSEINTKTKGNMKESTVNSAKDLWAKIKDSFLENEKYGGLANIEDSEKVAQSFLIRQNTDGESEALSAVIVEELDKEFNEYGSWKSVIHNNIGKENLSVFLQGGALFQAITNKEYIKEGYKGTRDGLCSWVTDNFGMEYSTFRARIQIYLALTNLSVSVKDISKLSVGKMRTLAQHGNTENIQQLLSEAFSMTGEEFKNRLRDRFSTADVLESEITEFSNDSQKIETVRFEVRLLPQELELVNVIKTRLAAQGVVDTNAENVNKQVFMALLNNLGENNTDNILNAGSANDIQEYLNVQYPNLEWHFQEKELNATQALNNELSSGVL